MAKTKVTSFYDQLTEEQKKRINSVLPKTLGKTKKLIRRTDNSGVISYVVLPTKFDYVAKNGAFKFEKAESIEAEKENLSRIIFEKEGGKPTPIEKKEEV